LDVHGEAREPDQKERENIPGLRRLDGEIHSQEATVNRHDGVKDGKPRVQLAGESSQILRGERHHKVDSPEQPDEDWHLDNHRTKTADGVEAHFLVGLHDLLLAKLRVVLVPLVDGAHAGAEVLHLAGLPDLTNDELVRGTTNQDGECDDGQAEVAA